jgi:hypothetical protein
MTPEFLRKAIVYALFAGVLMSLAPAVARLVGRAVDRHLDWQEQRRIEWVRP